jgi:hypothetical protein
VICFFVPEIRKTSTSSSILRVMIRASKITQLRRSAPQVPNELLQLCRVQLIICKRYINLGGLFRGIRNTKPEQKIESTPMSIDTGFKDGFKAKEVQADTNSEQEAGPEEGTPTNSILKRLITKHQVEGSSAIAARDAPVPVADPLSLSSRSRINVYDDGEPIKLAGLYRGGNLIDHPRIRGSNPWGEWAIDEHSSNQDEQVHPQQRVYYADTSIRLYKKRPENSETGEFQVFMDVPRKVAHQKSGDAKIKYNIII